MVVSFKDITLSIILHLGLILIITVMNPFTISMTPDFESIGINIIEMPPLGEPELIAEEMPEISIPRAVVEEDISIPLSDPESSDQTIEIEKAVDPPKPKPKPKKDPGYTSKTKEGETTQEGGTDISDQLGPGTKFGSAAIDNSNFNYPYYFVQSFGKIGRNWSNPVAANQPLSCIIYFQIIRSGTVLDPEIEKSSGVTAFDRACLRAVLASSPLPPLPPDFRDDIIGIHLEFPYKPR